MTLRRTSTRRCLMLRCTKRLLLHLSIRFRLAWQYAVYVSSLFSPSPFYQRSAGLTTRALSWTESDYKKKFLILIFIFLVRFLHGKDTIGLPSAWLLLLPLSIHLDDTRVFGVYLLFYNIGWAILRTMHPGLGNWTGVELVKEYIFIDATSSHG